MKKVLKASWYVLFTLAVLCGSRVIPVYSPYLIPVAFQQGPSATKFALKTGSFITGDCGQTAVDGSIVDAAFPCSNTIAGARPIVDKTLTTTPGNIVGASLTLASAGTYLVIAQFDFQITGAGDANQTMVGSLSAPGAVVAGGSAYDTVPTVGVDQTLSAFWIYTTAGASDVHPTPGIKKRRHGHE